MQNRPTRKWFVWKIMQEIDTGGVHHADTNSDLSNHRHAHPQIHLGAPTSEPNPFLRPAVIGRLYCLWLRIVRRRRGCSLRGRRQVLGQIAVHRGQVFIRRFHPSADHIVDDVAPLVRCMSLLVPTLDAVAIAAQAQGGIPTLSFRQGWHITTLRWLARRRGTSRRGRLRGFQEHQQLWRNCGRVGSASRLYRRISVNAKNRHGQQYIDCTLNQFHNLD